MVASRQRYTAGELAQVLGVSRQAVRQRAARGLELVATWRTDPDAHQLVPGHTRTGCVVCAGA
jgi:hypothetical protein